MTLSLHQVNCEVSTKRVAERDLPKVIESYAHAEGHVYAVMDHEVALGKLVGGQIWLGHPQLSALRRLDSFQYVQELRIFNSSYELRVLREEGELFRLRFLQDTPLSTPIDLPGELPSPNEQGTVESFHVLDETHKLWGAARPGHPSSAHQQGEGTLLASLRGTKLFYPEQLAIGEEKGLLVRNYIRFHPIPIGSEKPASLYEYVADRMVAFTSWPPPAKGE